MRNVIIYFMQPFIEAFDGASYISAAVSPSASIMEHPLADGSVIADHRIINPVEITVDASLQGEDYESIYQNIAGAFNRGDLFAIATKQGVFENMTLTDIPGDETPDNYGSILIRMTFRRAEFVRPRYQRLSPQDVAVASDAPTVDRGEVTVRQSLLARTFGGN